MFEGCVLRAHLRRCLPKLFIGTPDGPASQRLVFVHEHAENGVFYRLISGPVLVLLLQYGDDGRLAGDFGFLSFFPGRIIEELGTG